jgi:hypothetical protein
MRTLNQEISQEMGMMVKEEKMERIILIVEGSLMH